MNQDILILLVVNLIFYFKCLGYGYVSDDIPVAKRGRPANMWKRFWLQLEGSIRTTPKNDHALTMVIHALTAVFIYTGFGSNEVSFLAALLFSFNPINNQCSVWISGRGYAVSALTMCMAMTFPYVGPLILLFTTYTIAGFFAPLVLLGSEHAWMVLFLPLVWMFHAKHFMGNVKAKMDMELHAEDRKITWRKLVLMVKTMGFYFTHSLFPIKTTFYHSYMQSMAGSGKIKAYSFKDRFLWVGLVVLPLIAYRLAQPWDMVSFGLLWWVFCIAPFSNLYRMHQEISERYCYLPNVGLMFVLASYLINYPVLAACWVTMYATKMWFYMDAYQDDFYLVENASLNSPDSWFAWHVKAMRRWEGRSYNEAIIYWTMARAISPKEFKLLFNLATAFKICKQHDQADKFLEMAGENIPEGQEEVANKLIGEWKNNNVTVLL